MNNSIKQSQFQLAQAETKFFTSRLNIQLESSSIPLCKLLLSYDFELDEFQRDSIACVHVNESVHVTAHMFFGRFSFFLINEIKKALVNDSRVVYTSPIKALPSQKYLEL